MNPYDHAFYRRGSKPETIRVTERDKRWLAAWDRHDLLTPEEAAELLGDEKPSKKYLKERSRQFFRAWLIERPAGQQKARDRVRGTYPLLSCLDHGADKHLPPVPHLGRARASRAYRLRTMSATAIEHKRNQSRATYAIELACLKRGNVRFIPRNEIIKDASPEILGQHNPWGWPVRVLWHGEWKTIWIYPDQMFGLEFLDDPKRTKIYVTLENDEGTEQKENGNIDRTAVFVRKPLAYAHTFLDDLMWQNYGIKKFVSLTLATRKKPIGRRYRRTKSQRSDELRDLAARHTLHLVSHKQFLFADREDFLASDDPLSFLCKTTHPFKQRSLIPEPPATTVSMWPQRTVDATTPTP